MPAKEQTKKPKVVKALDIGPGVARGSEAQYGRVHTKGRPSYADYDSMLLDPTISSSVELITCAIAKAIGNYKHPSTDIEDYVNRQFENLDGDLNTIVRTLCLSYWYGLSVAEICAEVVDGELTLQKLIPIPAKNIYLVFANQGTSLDVEEIILNYSSIQEVTIPKEKVILIRHGADFNRPYGVSRLETVRAQWQQLNNLKTNWQNASNRYSSPFMVYHLTNPKQKVSDGMGGTITAYDNASQALTGTGLVKGTICCGEDTIEVIPAEDISPNMVTACEYYEKLIYRGLLIPSLLTDSGDVGSYALGKEHSSLFNMVVNQLARDIEDNILEQLVRPLVSYQYGEQEDWGHFEQDEEQEIIENTETPIGEVKNDNNAE